MLSTFLWALCGALCFVQLHVWVWGSVAYCVVWGLCEWTHVSFEVPFVLVIPG